MNRKVIGIAVAIVLAAVGTVALVSYVRSAEERAQAGEELVEVYVITEAVPAGTAGSSLEQYIEIQSVPAKVQAVNSVQSLQSLEGRVASVDLVAGEQLVRTRFVEPADVSAREEGVIIPPGKVELTVQLEQQRVIGGLLKPGDTVAVFASFDPFEISTGVVEVDGEEVPVPDAVSGGGGQTPHTTTLLFNKVLVTAVQQSASGGGFGASDDEDESRLDRAPSAALFITVAVDPAEAERVVFTQEFGRVYLALERSDVPESPTDVVTRGNVYEAPAPVAVSR